jgi:iron-sulfur cluster repair protein YtfE (RIC family)
MLTRIGHVTPASGLVGMLGECHGRIRDMSALSRLLAHQPQTAPAEARDAARRIEAYFGRALPLHVRDEEESILPRLRGREAALDAALGQMAAQHTSHEAPLRSLVELCRALRDGERDLPSLAAELVPLTAELERELLAHLELEESVIFPAIDRLLGPTEQEAIIRELRARRGEGGRRQTLETRH